MTDATNTNTAHAAALAMRDAAAALARRRPLYDGASGEPADEDLAQAIEDLPLPVDTTDWKAEAEPCSACGGSGWVTRDPDIGTDTECPVCSAWPYAGELRRERDELAAQVHIVTSERDELAQAREVLSDCATTLEGYARHHAERGPEHAHKVARNAELAARCRAVLSAKGE